MELRGGLEMKQPKEKYAHYGLYMVVMSLLVLAIVVLANGSPTGCLSPGRSLTPRRPVCTASLRRLRRLRRG